MPSSFQEVRRQVLRRVSYATNTSALLDNRLPPEGPFDTALTNGLLAIVADQWPGMEATGNGLTKSARQLLGVIDEHGSSFQIDTWMLADGLDLTQPYRHGRADDEFAVLRPDHIHALIALDRHPALRLLDEVTPERDVDDLIRLAFLERAEEELPVDPKDRSLVPDLEDCEECGRPTFLPCGWDIFGGTMTAGQCIACGQERSEDRAYENAVTQALHRAIAQND